MPLIYEFPPSIVQKCEISHKNMGIDGDFSYQISNIPYRYTAAATDWGTLLTRPIVEPERL